MAFEGSFTFSYILTLRLFVFEKTTSISYLYSPITHEIIYSFTSLATLNNTLHTTFQKPSLLI